MPPPKNTDKKNTKAKTDQSTAAAADAQSTSSTSTPAAANKPPESTGKPPVDPMIVTTAAGDPNPPGISPADWIFIKEIKLNVVSELMEIRSMVEGMMLSLKNDGTPEQYNAAVKSYENAVSDVQRAAKFPPAFLAAAAKDSGLLDENLPIGLLTSKVRELLYNEVGKADQVPLPIPAKSPSSIWQKCVTFANQIGGSTVMTNYSALCDRVIDSSSFILRLNHLVTAEEKSAVVGRYYFEAIRTAYPIAQCFYIIQPAFFGAAMNALHGPHYDALARIYPSCQAGGTGKKSDLTIYKDAVTDWRKKMSPFLDVAIGFGDLIGRTTSIVRASVAMVNILNEMLELLIYQFSQRTNIKDPIHFDSRQSKKEPEHVKVFREFIHSDGRHDYVGNIPITKRGNITKGTPTKLPEEADEPGSLLLLSTAVAYIFQTEDEDHDPAAPADSIGDADYFVALKTCGNIYLSTAALEAISLIASNKDGDGNKFERSEFDMQDAAMDILFNAFFWMRYAGINEQEMPIVNKFLYNMFSRPLGAAKRKELIEKCPATAIKKLKPIITYSTDIHLLPFLLSINRFEEFSAVWGTMNMFAVAEVGSCSWRHSLNFKGTSANGLKFITNAFSLEQSAFSQMPGKDEQIYKSLHLLHQFLLGKKSPFEWAANVTGNAMDVKFVRE